MLLVAAVLVLVLMRGGTWRVTGGLVGVFFYCFYTGTKGGIFWWFEGGT